MWFSFPDISKFNNVHENTPWLAKSHIHVIVVSVKKLRGSRKCKNIHTGKKPYLWDKELQPTFNFQSCFRVHGERKHKINKSSCSLFLQTKVLLGKMHASSLSQCVTCCYKSDPGKLPVYKGVVIIHQHGGAMILLGGSPFLSPSNKGLMIFSLNSIGGHLFVFKWFHQMKNNFRGLGILWFPWREVM